jgi:hypothetical protein
MDKHNIRSRKYWRKNKIKQRRKKGKEQTNEMRSNKNYVTQNIRIVKDNSIQFNSIYLHAGLTA